MTRREHYLRKRDREIAELLKDYKWVLMEQGNELPKKAKGKLAADRNAAKKTESR